MLARLIWIPEIRWWLLLIAGICVLVTTNELSGQQAMIRVPFQGEEVPGRPLIKTSRELYMLGRDGQLRHFLRSDVGRTIPTTESFRSYSTEELRNRLVREFGRRYEVSIHGNFVVVHPTGERSIWPNRFDALYRSFLHYFSARGITLQRPSFPFVAIVFYDQAAFARYASQQGDPVNSNVLGYYSPRTNRIALYDRNAGRDSSNWEVNAATLIHEAAHQTAFNVGIHNRFAPPPRWVTEGLGTMFEARGVNNSFQYSLLSDRVNANQRAMFERYVERDHQPGDLARLVSSNRMFEQNPGNAYALAWALSFYLAETQPRPYVGYLRTTAARSDFTAYPPAEQLQDFSQAFGNNLDLLETRVIRYVDELPR